MIRDSRLDESHIAIIHYTKTILRTLLLSAWKYLIIAFTRNIGEQIKDKRTMGVSLGLLIHEKHTRKGNRIRFIICRIVQAH